jgi:hypothetical protein
MQAARPLRYRVRARDPDLASCTFAAALSAGAHRLEEDARPPSGLVRGFRVSLAAGNLFRHTPLWPWNVFRPGVPTTIGMGAHITSIQRMQETEGGHLDAERGHFSMSVHTELNPVARLMCPLSCINDELPEQFDPSPCVSPRPPRTPAFPWLPIAREPVRLDRFGVCRPSKAVRRG